jgi:hypothetical protein
MNGPATTLQTMKTDSEDSYSAKNASNNSMESVVPFPASIHLNVSVCKHESFFHSYRWLYANMELGERKADKQTKKLEKDNKTRREIFTKLTEASSLPCKNFTILYRAKYEVIIWLVVIILKCWIRVGNTYTHSTFTINWNYLNFCCLLQKHWFLSQVNLPDLYDILLFVRLVYLWTWVYSVIGLNVFRREKNNFIMNSSPSECKKLYSRRITWQEWRN